MSMDRDPQDQETRRWKVLLRRAAPYLPPRPFRASLWAIVATALYLFVFASDRYVSEAHVVVDSSDISASESLDIGSQLTGTKSSHDQLMLQDHLLSMDMLKQLDTKLNLRAHYSDHSRDQISRMWFKNAQLEWFNQVI